MQNQVIYFRDDQVFKGRVLKMKSVVDWIIN